MKKERKYPDYFTIDVIKPEFKWFALFVMFSIYGMIEFAILIVKAIIFLIKWLW